MLSKQERALEREKVRILAGLCFIAIALLVTLGAFVTYLDP